MKLKAHLAINLAVVLGLGVGMIAWVLTRVVGGGAFGTPMTVAAEFAASGGVYTNQEVTYRGVLIGQVGALSLTDDGVRIELLINPEWAGRIPADVEATVKSKSAVGEQYVDLVPGPSTSTMLAHGDIIPRDRTHLPVDFQDLLRTLDAVLQDVPPGQTRRVIQGLAAGVGGRSRDIASILRSLGRLSDAFADVAPEQQRLLANATATGSAFLSTKDEFAAALEAADSVLAGIADEPEELEALLERNSELAQETTALLAKRSDDLASGIKGLAEFVDFQLDHRNELITKTLDYVPAFLHAVEDASIPWRSPDGREFYRIRLGLIFDNVESTWPCQYRLRDGYQRFPHEREKRDPVTSANCVPPSTDRESEDALEGALRRWADADPDDLARAARRALANVSGGKQAAGPERGPPDLLWPLDGPINSFFGTRPGGEHNGVDIDGDGGDPVSAAAGGRVVMTEPYFGYGNTVVIDHGGGLRTLYGHLSALRVHPGERVENGDVIGLVGCTGTCDGDHLHFEVQVHRTPVDPLRWLPGGSLYRIAGVGQVPARRPAKASPSVAAFPPSSASP